MIAEPAANRLTELVSPSSLQELERNHNLQLAPAQTQIGLTPAPKPKVNLEQLKVEEVSFQSSDEVE